MALAEIYDAAFAGVSFLELFDGGYAAGPEQQEQLTEVHIPGSNTTIIQTVGVGLRRATINIACTKADLDSLFGKIGTEGSLTWHQGSETARLTGISGVRKAGGRDMYRATLQIVFP